MKVPERSLCPNTKNKEITSVKKAERANTLSPKDVKNFNDFVNILLEELSRKTGKKYYVRKV